MSRCPVSESEIDYDLENQRILSGTPINSRANGLFCLEPPELIQKVKREKLDEFVFDLMNNHDYVIDGKSFALHECMSLIDQFQPLWEIKIADRGQCETFGEIFADDPLKAAQIVADKLLPALERAVILNVVIRVAKLQLDIE